MTIDKGWMHAVLVGAALASLPGDVNARDRGLNQPGAVGISNPGTGLHDQRNGFLIGIATALAQERLQVLARNVFHDNEELALVETKIMYGDDVGVGKICSSTRLLAEALLEGFILRIMLVQQLYRHIAFQHQITRPEDIRHAAMAQTLQELITIIEDDPFLHDGKLYQPPPQPSPFSDCSSSENGGGCQRRVGVGL